LEHEREKIIFKKERVGSFDKADEIREKITEQDYQLRIELAGLVSRVIAAEERS